MREKYVNWTTPMVRDLKELSEKEVMQKYDLTGAQVRQAAYRFGVRRKTRKNLKWTESMIADLKVMSSNDLCEKYGIEYELVRSARKRHDAYFYGERHGRVPRFTAEDVACIFEMRTIRKTWDQIAREFGVSRTTVYQVYRRALENGFDSYPPRSKVA